MQALLYESVGMNYKKIVFVKYHDPELNGMVYSVGYLRKGINHSLLIHGEIKSIGLYTYTIIPRAFITEVYNLKVK